MDGTWRLIARLSEQEKREGEPTNALESNDYVAFARDGIVPFAVGGKVVIVPKDVGLSVRS
jgi:hypothetical protein